MKSLIGCLVDLGAGYGAYFVLNALPIGTALPRGIFCTAIFEQGEDARTTFEREVAEHPLFAMTTYEVDATQRLVEARSVMGLVPCEPFIDPGSVVPFGGYDGRGTTDTGPSLPALNTGCG